VKAGAGAEVLREALGHLRRRPEAARVIAA
jgi:hypothetical protein